MEIMCVVLLAGMGAACSLLDLHNDGDSPRKDTERNDSTAVEEALQYDTLIYSAGVQFPAGYNWQVDTLTESEKGSIVLYKGEELLISLPVGYENNISADPDMYRIIDGHLYTDYSTDKETIIKKDGQEIFRYEGREALCGFATMDDNVWTLGQNRSGSGLCLRKNGKLVYSHPLGIIIGNTMDTYNPGGALFFIGKEPAFFFRYFSSEGPLSKVTKCYYVKGDQATELEVPSNFSRIMDAKFVGGLPVMAGMRGYAINMICIIRNGTSVGYTLTGFDKIGSCKITPVGDDDYYLSGECYSAGLNTGFICDHNGQNLFIDLEGRLVGFYVCEGVDVILSCGEFGQDPVITTNGRSKSLSGKYLYISPRCGFLLDKQFYLGLNPAEGSGPFILIGKKQMPLNFNGFITEVQVKVVQKQKTEGVDD